MPNNLSNLQTKPTEHGFSVLAINAGVAKGHDIEFTSEVLKDSLSLWNAVPCMLDHPGFLDNPSVRDLAGSLHLPVWDELEQGIICQSHAIRPSRRRVDQVTRSQPRPTRPLCQPWGSPQSCGCPPSLMARSRRYTRSIKRRLRYQSRSRREILSQGGFEPPLVTPAPRGAGASSNIQGVETMSDETSTTPAPQADETQKTQELLDASKKAEAKKHTADESLRALRLQTCRTLLKVSLECLQAAPAHSRPRRPPLHRHDRQRPALRARRTGKRHQ